MSNIKLFETKKVRTHWDDEQEKTYFSIVDVIEILTDSINPPTYWRKLKERLKAEGNETVTNCHALKMLASDGKMRLTDVADTEQLLRLIQSIPSPKAEQQKSEKVKRRKSETRETRENIMKTKVKILDTACDYLDEDIPSEIDFSDWKPNPYAKHDTVNIELAPDVAHVFTNSEKVNSALRLIMQSARSIQAML